MPLEEYRRKRSFAKTPEPSGASDLPSGGQLTYVIHKHAASRLHYDLRLEIDGVYASWAIPKGPSLDTGQKRLAVHVEDHPLEYGEFEGTIPAGQYGGGTVMVWDRGVFAPLGDPLVMLAAGNLKFVLAGAKLAGAFALVRMKPRAGEKGDNWLLIKERDEHVRLQSQYDVTALEPDSAASGRTMDEIAAGAPARTVPAAKSLAAVRALPADAPFQLATLATSAPEGDEWIHEVKYDGYRLRLSLDHGRARAITRNGQDWSDRFPGLVAAVGLLPVTSVLLDGEAVVFDEQGRSDFSALQGAISGGGAGVAFAAFDLLYLNGFDVRDQSLLRRKELLSALLDGAPPTGPLQFAKHHVGSGAAFHDSACDLHLEGSVSKRGDRPWVEGRTRDWVKVKCVTAQEFVVVGFTDPAGSRAGFGALLLGVHGAQGELRYAGKVGSGFSDRELVALRRRLDDLATDSATVANPPRLANAHWVRPEIVVDVAYREWTPDGLLRQPVYRGLRDDADPAAVVRERPDSADAASTPPLTVKGVRISNPDKILQPAGVTKAELARYYEAIAEVMLPHVEGRFLTAVRCPSGKGGAADCFYQKHPEPRGWPPALHTTSLAEKDGAKEYFFIDDAQGLLELTQLGVAEIHAWNSRVGDPGRPDRLVFDLDPGEGVEFAGVVDAARMLRAALETLGLSAFVKTTGGRGLHLVVPIEVEHDFETARAATHTLCEWLAATAPEIFTAKMAKSVRVGRIFIDYLRNARGATAVCAYSVRARQGAAVSLPLTWDELSSDLDPLGIRMTDVLARLERRGPDPWTGYEEARSHLDVSLITQLGDWGK